VTDAQAQAEAERRWGPKAVAKYVEKKLSTGFTWRGCFVADCTCAKFCWRGVGDSWESAFADADRRLEAYLDVTAPPDNGPLFATLDPHLVRKNHGFSKRSPLDVPRRRKLPVDNRSSGP